MSLHRIDGIEAEIWVEPTAEQWFWVKWAGWLFAPAPEEDRGFSRWLSIFTVVPSTNVTNTSLWYQAWLNEIFHTTWVARVGHFVFIPLNTILMVALAGRFSAAAAALLGSWWVCWALKEGRKLWAVACLGLAVAVGTAAAAWNAAGWPVVLPMIAFSFLQALSHALEDLPPRVTRSPRWVPMKEYLRGTAEHPLPWQITLQRLGHVALQLPFGAVDEWMASPRLLPVYLLDVLWRLGYDPASSQELRGYARKAWARGNPALDYIGIGGGTRLKVPPGADLASE